MTTRRPPGSRSPWPGLRWSHAVARAGSHRPCDAPDRIDDPNLGRILRLAADLTKALAIDDGLANVREEFHEAFLGAYPGMTCATLE